LRTFGYARARRTSSTIGGDSTISNA
jgi:hypothetical protein